MKELITSEHGSIKCFSYLKKHDLENYVKEECVDPKGYEDKVQEGLSQSQEDYFRLHWISNVSALKTPKEMFDAMTSLYEGNNINKKKTLRTQLKDVKMQMSESIQSYFTRISQIKEQLETKEAEVEITTLNGLPSSWESFIQGICSRRKLTYRGMHVRSSLIDKKEEEMDEYDNQVLTTHSKKRKNKKGEHSCKNKRTSHEGPHIAHMFQL